MEEKRIVDKKKTVIEEDLLKRIQEVMQKDLSREEFVEEANRILETEYTVEDVEWDEVWGFR